MPVWVAILIALAATSLMNFGLALQKKGAASLPKIGVERGGKVLKAFLTTRIWLLGFGVCLPVLIAANVVGMGVMQSGFQHGKALVVVSLEAVINKAVAIIGGMLALAETLPEDPAKSAMRVTAFVLILFGTGALARFGGAELAEKMEQR